MKFAFVTPRYGADVNSGAEHACRLLAEQLSARHHVDVLTTCTRDDRSWKNEYSEGSDRVRGAIVRRFAVNQLHDSSAFDAYTARLLSGPRTRADELEWVRRLGPSSPALLDHLKRQHRSYDVIVFFSLWHATTVSGLEIAPEKSVIFPYLQLRQALRFELWSDMISSAGALGFLSAAERQLLHGYVRGNPRREEVVGIGLDPPPPQTYPRHQQNPADTVQAEEDGIASHEPEEAEPGLSGRGIPFRRRHRLYGSFVMYGGRVEPANGSEEMLDYYDSYAAGSDAPPLVLMGFKLMKLPEEPYIRLAGVLPERERMPAYQAADLTITPGADDALSLPLLESLAVGTPVLASARNHAAVDHLTRANAGLVYADRAEFVETMKLLMSNERLRRRLGENGQAYIDQHFRWEAVLGRFDRLIAGLRPRSH